MEGDIPFITFQKSKIELEETLEFQLVLRTTSTKILSNLVTVYDLARSYM